MYIVTNVNFDSGTKGVSYGTLAGKNGGRPTYLGSETNSSKLRGALLAVNLGLRILKDLYGSNERFKLDILIEDAAIASQFLNKTDVVSKMHGDNDALWAEYLSRISTYDVRIVSHPGESEVIRCIWAWGAYPQSLPGTMPVGY
jgi:hypothetical protein